MMSHGTEHTFTILRCVVEHFAGITAEDVRYRDPYMTDFRVQF